GFASHNAGQGAFGHGLGLVERLARPDALHQVLVFLLVRVDILFAEPIAQLFVAAPDPVFAVAGSFRADDRLLDFSFAAIHLTALAEHARAAWIFVFDGKMVVNVAVILIWP